MRKMLGVVVFSDHDEVVYVNGNAQMRAKLLLKQSEFSADSSTSGYSEMGSSGDRMSNSPSPLEQNIARKKSSDFDMNALTQYFLPLIVMYRAKEELDGDPYRQIKVPELQLLFKPMRDRFIMVVMMSSSRANADRMRRLMKDVAAAFSLYMGPLLPLFSSSQSPMKSCRRKLARAIDEIIANFDGPSFDNHQWLARSVDIGAYTFSTQSPLARELAIVANELQLFLGISHCLIINNRQLLAAYSTPLAKNGSPVQVLPVRDILLLLRSASQSSNRPPLTKPKCQHAWLTETSSPDKAYRTLWDIFRVEIVAGTELICAGESNCAPLVSKIATLVDCMTKMRMSRDLEFLVLRCGHLVDDVCRHLLDMVPDESTRAKSFLVNLQNTTQLLHFLWEKLRTRLTADLTDDAHLSMEGRRRLSTASTVSTELSVDAESQITHFSSQLRLLMQQLVAKSFEAARKYKVMLFNKTCTRLNFSHFSSTKLLYQAPPVRFSSVTPSSLSLDLHAYFFICQNKRLCFCHIPAEYKHEFNTALLGTLEKKSLQRLSVAKLSLIEPSEDMLIILVTNTTAMPTPSATWSKTKMRSIWGALTKKSTHQDELEFGQISEPVWCLALFDSFIHKDLAVAQTQKLATALYQRATSVQWSFR